MERRPLTINHEKGHKKKRARPSLEAQDKILTEQNNRCFYCGFKLHEWFWDKRKRLARCRDLHWDHLSPFIHSYNNNDNNFVASCVECNGLKHAKLFDTLDEAANYIRSRRTARGIPVHGVWGNKTTQKALATVLFSDLSEQVFLEKAQNEDSPETLQRKLDNIKELRRLLRNI